MDIKIRKKELFLKQEEEAIKKIAKQYFYDKILAEPDNITDYVPKSLVEDFQKYCKKRTGQRYAYCMITVNFKPDVKIADIIKYTLKAHKKRWIKAYFYAYEQHGDYHNVGHHPHLHTKLWLEENKNSYEVKREFYNTFKHIVGNKLHVNVRYSNTANCFEEYIMGIKNKEPKPTADTDKIWREQNKLQAIYFSSNYLEQKQLEQANENQGHTSL